jgi:hypothetical protein
MCHLEEESFTEHEARLEALDKMHNTNLEIIKRNNLNPMFQGILSTTFPGVIDEEVQNLGS